MIALGTGDGHMLMYDLQVSIMSMTCDMHQLNTKNNGALYR